jgi:[acyl-carrier-protein] S-malonyltransferase
MSGIALIFPGQGSQAVGMGSKFGAAFADCRRLFDRAGELLGYDLARLCREGPAERLNLTEYTQPALLAASTCAFMRAREAGLAPQMVAGHSLGEYTALVAAGCLDFETALILVRNRGRYMQEAVPPGVGAMAAILGLDQDTVAAVCREAAAGGVVAPANINSPVQIVIAGQKAAVESAMQLALARGAKRALPLAVSVPSHCALMEPAARRLSADLAQTRFNDAAVPVVVNVSARPLREAAALKQALVEQLAAPVQWIEMIRTMAAAGVGTFIEVGPGTVLSGLVRRIAKQARVCNVEDPESLEATLAAVRGA